MLSFRAHARLVGIFAVAVSHVVFAQTARPTIGQLDHTVWTLRDGAPSFIDALAQTNDGMLWMGTNSGLYRFDGIRFEEFTPPTKEASFSRAISALTAMPDGALWVGFVSGDVRVLMRDRVVSFTPGGTAAGRISGIVRDSTGDTWVSSMNNLARLHDGRWQLMGDEQSYSGKRVGSLFVDNRGTLWVATEIGLYVLPRGTHRFVRQADSPNFMQGGFNTPGEAPDGSVWGASLALGVTRLSDSSGRPVAPQSGIDGIGPSVRVYIDHQGVAWIGQLSPGLWRTQLSVPAQRLSSTIERLPLVSGSIASALLEGADGSMWVGTGGGLERFRRTALTSVTLPKDARWPGLAPGGNGAMWLTSLSYPVSALTDELHPIDDTPDNITCVLRDLDGGIWFGGAGKIWHVPPNTPPTSAHLTPVALPREGTFGHIVAMARTTDGDLWVSNGSSETMRGVFRLHNGTWSRAPLSEHAAHTTSLTVIADSAGQVWLGFGNRLLRVRHDSTRIYADTARFRPGNIMALQAHGSRVWIGGKTGFAVLEHERIYPIAATTDVRNVTGIVETATGDIWLNSSDGVVHIASSEVHHALTDSLYRVRVERFDQHDGLTGDPVQLSPRPTAIQGGDGRLWFTTSTSVVWIDPANISRSAKPPPVQVRALTAAGKTYDVAHRISLPVQTTQLEVAYTAIDLAKPDRVAFRYQLLGVDTTWVEAGPRREAFYTNLKPGPYRFRVSAANEDGVWNEAGASIDFEIPPSFTQTRAFIGVLVGVIALSLLGAGWLLAFWRHRQMARALHANFEGQLAERARVARELHDTLLGDMIGVALQLSAAANRTAAAPDNGTIANLLSSLSRQVQGTIGEARRSVSAIRATPAMPLPLHEQLAAAAQRTFADASVSIRVAHAGSPRMYSGELESQIVSIAREAIANARRHADCRTVTVSCTYAGHGVQVRVRDDGRGFDSSRATPTGHWGLVGMRERAALIGATLSITSEIGVGTEVLIIARIDAARLNAAAISTPT